MNTGTQLAESFFDDTDLRDHSSLFTSLLDQSELAVLVVNIDSLEILWASRACVELDSRLAPGSSIHAFAELLEVFNTVLCEGTVDDLSSVGSRMTSAAFLTLKTSRNQNINVRIKRIGLQGCKLMLHIEPEQKSDNYYRHYVAERDKLFNTSRALTVNEMATTLAHELNQPIGTVVNLLHGSLDRLEKHNVANELSAEAQVNADVLEAIDFAIRQSRFASQIIARVREFTEARQPDIEVVDMRQVVKASVELLDWVLASEKIDLSIDVGSESLFAGCDKMLLQQVLVNLCRNAIEAMREVTHGDRRLIILCYRSDDGIYIEVSDTGPGMADDAMGDMFKPFVSTKPHGMGVGLNICRSFVELHQGKLWVTRNKYHGCTVKMRLPES